MNRLQLLFVANASVLCVHQIDAAYWHEWTMFQLPGGNQANLFLNLPLVASVFVAFWHVAVRSRWRVVAHLYLASLGGITVVVHASFFSAGYMQFLQPFSIGLIVATGFLSLAQVLLVRKGPVHDTRQDGPAGD